MGEYRDLVEAIIRYGNHYAALYTKPLFNIDGISLCPAEIQVLEYILENEEAHQNMAELSRRLGISPSSFTKRVTKLTGLGLLCKYHREGNRKDVIVLASDEGKALYKTYAQQSYDAWMHEVATRLSCVPQKHIETFTRVMQYVTGETNGPPCETEPALTPIE